MSKVVRLPEDVIEIALKYGKNLAEGIRTMDKLLEEYKELDKKLADVIETRIRDVIREELEMLRRF
ncbi:hypothetical protein DRO97_05380 [Archaeoglobales archaeon]|nr:MAG: hypothetical protein DRO97_05380 [Archaeoglobales archaeon]